MHDCPRPHTLLEHNVKRNKLILRFSMSTSNTFFTVRKSTSFSPSSCVLCLRFTGQNQWLTAHFHVLTFMSCFVLTIYGCMWVGWLMCAHLKMNSDLQREYWLQVCVGKVLKILYVCLFVWFFCIRHFRLLDVHTLLVWMRKFWIKLFWLNLFTEVSI